MGRIFRLKTRSRAVLSENDQRSAIPIPASALVVVVGGDIDEDADGREILRCDRCIPLGTPPPLATAPCHPETC